MRAFLIFLFALLLSTGLTAQVLTCYDVQYTEDPSGNSPYAGSVVTVEGVVVAEKYYTGTSATSYGFFISDPEGGPWSGLLIFTNQYHPQRGDWVRVTGTIVEWYGFTEMSPTTSFQVISQGNPLPPPTLINTGDLIAADAEKWEGSFVKVQNVNVTNLPNNYLEFYVNDGTGACQVDDQCFPRSGFSWPSLSVGQNWARIQGVVDFSFDYYAINPRDLEDMLLEDTVANATVRTETTSANINEQVAMNVLTSRILSQWGVASYTATIKIDPNKVLFHGLDFAGTMSAFLPNFTVSAAGDTIVIVYQSQEPINSTTDDQILIKLLLEPVSYGEALVQILSFAYDNTPLQGISSGRLLTAIRRNIAWLNIANPNNNKNIFNPALNEKITIEYGCKLVPTGVNTKAIIRIYDAQGRLVSTPVNKNISNALGVESIQWDGRDTNMKLLPIGLYYCHLEVIDRASGAKEITVQPIVIKSVMK